MRNPLERIIAYLLGFFLPPLLIGGMILLTSVSQSMSVEKPAPLPPDTIKKTVEQPKARFKALFVLGDGGTQVSDLLVPYEILAESKFFNLATAAPTYDLVPTTGQVSILPDFSYNDAPDADLLIIPGLITQVDKTFMDWISEKARAAQVVLVLSDGARVAAQAGLMQGRKATGHFLAAQELAKLEPSATWNFGKPWVDDGKVISSPGIAASVEATLHVVDRMAAPGVAARTARELGISWNPQASEENQLATKLDFRDFLTLFLRGGFQLSKHHVGMVIYPGVSEISLAALLDTLPRSLEARIFTVAADRKPIASRHGLQLVPTETVETVFKPDLAIVPSGLGTGGTPPPLDPLKTDKIKNWVQQGDILVKNLVYDIPGRGYTTAIELIAQYQGSSRLQSFVAKLVGYPLAAAPQDKPSANDSTLSLWTPPLSIGFLGLALVALLDFKLRQRRVELDSDLE